MNIKIISPCFVDGVAYETGDTIEELNDSQANSLILMKRAVLYDEEVKPKRGRKKKDASES